MYLPDFTKSRLLNEVREKMGAELVEWSPSILWQGFDPEEWRRLEREGIEVPLQDVVPADDGTLEYRGQKIVLYIRDQRVTHRHHNDSGGGYRFHISDCDTLRRMRDEGRYERYVVSTRKDGKFIVNRFEFNMLLGNGVEVELPVCKNCLKRINWQNYKQRGSSEKDRIWKSFDLIDYFDRYNSKITIIPKHTEKTAPLSEYTPDWNIISNKYRENVGWKCEECGLRLEEEKKFLHVHHRNGVRSDNSWYNLQALCIKCHANKPDHDHLKNSPDYAKFMEFLNSRL